MGVLQDLDVVVGMSGVAKERFLDRVEEESLSQFDLGSRNDDCDVPSNVARCRMEHPASCDARSFIRDEK